LKKITWLLVLLSVTFGYAQNRKGQLRLGSTDYPHELYVSFGMNIALISNDFEKELKEKNAEFKALSEQYSFEITKGIAMTEEQLFMMENRALKVSKSANSVKKLRNIFKISIPNASNEELLALASEIEKISIVEYCNLSSLEPIKPPVDIAPETPNWEAIQGYIQANPGVNMQYAWDLNLTGQGIRLRDVEYGFNKNHEELMDVNCFLAPGMTVNSNATTDFTEHGTGVFGILYADKGNYGISGLAYGAEELVLYAEWLNIGYNRNWAITQAINNSTIGDVIIYEMQTYGFGATNENYKYVPAEYDQVVWDLTKAATDSGIIIVAAAGNGNQNLDSSDYASYMSRGNSGAIIVGAGSSTATHSRLSYSTYGSRVNLQGWGNNVLSSGYGDLHQIGSDFNQYYTNFSGTSSATPIVAACAAVLLSYHYSLTGEYLTNADLIAIMQETGISQGGNTSANIGPLPNMQAAIQKIYNDYLLNVSHKNEVKFSVYPNPVQEYMSFLFSDTFQEIQKVEVLNALGQLVMVSKLSEDKKLNVSQLVAGVYFVAITTNHGTAVQRIIKK
jgi:hypothetical protein